MSEIYGKREILWNRSRSLVWWVWDTDNYIGESFFPDRLAKLCILL